MTKYVYFFGGGKADGNGKMKDVLGGKGAGLTFVVYGAMIVLIARFQPGGILTLVKRLSERRTKAGEPASVAGASHAP